MCFGGGSNAGKGIAREQKGQEDRVKQGLAQLQAIFYGGQYGTNPSKAYDPKAAYYGATGKPYAFDSTDPGYQAWQKGQPATSNVADKMPENLRLASGLQGDALRRQWLAEHSSASEPPLSQQDQYKQFLAKSGGLFTGTANEKGFTPEFFDQAKNAYLGFALPQLSGQFGQARQGLDYRLANQGLIGSSAAHNLQNRLGNEAVLQKQNISNQAIGQSQQLERDVNQQYQQLVGQLQASANPSEVSGQALKAAANFQQPSAFPAVGQLFQNFSQQYLANQLGNAYGQGGANYRLPTYSGGSGAPITTYKG